jgi:hypothetical protein
MVVGTSSGAETGQMIDRAFAHEKKKDVFIQDALAEPSLGGLTHCRWNVCFLMPQDVI